jgi:predicted O-methyltransferase YrrM
VTQELWAEIEQDARWRLALYDTTIVKADSVQAASVWPDGHFDFVYIDGDHSEAAVIADLMAWGPKVRKGGVLSGHDWNLPEVRSAVMGAYVGNLQVTDERSPSWWFTRG